MNHDGMQGPVHYTGFGESRLTFAHLAASTSPWSQTTPADFNRYVTVSTAVGAPQRVNGRMAASKSPDLGITPKLDVLGKRLVEVH